MPRPNPLRSIESESNLSRRVAFERERAGLGYEALAKLMTEAGCAIQGSAIFKIEKGEPQRRITVDELVAFGRVFKIDTDDLLMPWTTADERTQRLKDELARIEQQQAGLVEVADQIRRKLAES